MEKLLDPKIIFTKHCPQTEGVLIRISSDLQRGCEIVGIHGHTLSGEEFSYTRKKPQESYPGIYRIWGLVVDAPQGTALVSLETGDEQAITDIIRFNPNARLTVWLKGKRKPLVIRTSVNANTGKR